MLRHILYAIWVHRDLFIDLRVPYFAQLQHVFVRLNIQKIKKMFMVITNNIKEVK